MTEVLVIGCGIAGLSCAVRAAELGCHVTVASPQAPERSESVMAMGGINAALDTRGEGDSTQLHFEDTMRGGCDLGDPEAVRLLVQDAPDIVRWLAAIGTNFSRTSGGEIALRPFGAQSRVRTAYAGAHTGKQIVCALSAQARRHEAAGELSWLNGTRLLSLVRDEDGSCVGATLLDAITGEMRAVPADSVVLAFGMPGGVYGETTGSITNDASAAGVVLSSGLEFSNLEMVQFHPTTVKAGGKRLLISEAARGMGGRLYALRDGKPWYFMDEWYPDGGALMPRDVVTRCMYRVVFDMGLKNEGRDEVLLDLTHIPRSAFDHELDEVLDTCLTYLGLDPREVPIPVVPGIHYFMGGILTDSSHRTNVARAFSAGGCSAQCHGANRLGGNSLLGAVRGGLVAAAGAAELGGHADPTGRDRAVREVLARDEAARDAWALAGTGTARASEIRHDMAQIMCRDMWIYRDGESLSSAAAELRGLRDRAEHVGTEDSYYACLSSRSAVRVAEAMVAGALERRESRGAHQRRDYPEPREEYRRNCVVTWGDNGAEAGMR